MQKFSNDLPASDRRVVRRWRLVVVSFYGSLLAVMLVMALLSNRDVQVARSDPPFGAHGK
ncbi:nitrogen fixation protein FixH [Bradyrhizobium niftali]